MKIVRVCPVYYPFFEHGGSVVADYELDKALVAEGHNLKVITCKKSMKESHSSSLSQNHKVLYFSSLGNIIYGISLGPLIWLIVNCLKKNNNIDLVWFGGIWNLQSILGPIICRTFSKKYIISPHGMLVPHLINLKSSFIKSIVIKLFHKKNLKNANKVHFTVKQEFDDTIQAIKTDVSPLIFPLFFDLRKFTTALDNNPNKFYKNKITLSFIGRITPKKRIDLIFKALNELPANLKDKIRFHIIGPDAENLWNNDLYNETKVGVEIKYFGPLYDDELIKAYRECDVFILCSESENFAISVIEAAYSCSALLISKEVGVSEYFSESSAVFASANNKDICLRLTWLINNKDQIYKYKIAAKEVSEQFDTSSLSKDYFQNLLT